MCAHPVRHELAGRGSVNLKQMAMESLHLVCLIQHTASPQSAPRRHGRLGISLNYLNSDEPAKSLAPLRMLLIEGVRGWGPPPSTSWDGSRTGIAIPVGQTVLGQERSVL